MHHTSDLGTSANLPITTKIPGYRFRRESGSDRIGIWLDAEQESLGRKVTVKILRPELEEVEAAQREFLAEMDRLLTLDHSGLLRVLDTVRTPPLALVTERAAGATLQGLLDEKKPMGPKSSARLARSVLGALIYLESKDLAHKNVTPSFIQLKADDQTRLVTFRNIISIDSQKALKGKLVQDANYVAPEQLGGSFDIGPNTIVYQVASLWFHMLAAQPPHVADLPLEVAKLHFHKDFPSLRRLQPFLAPPIYDVFARCGAKDPSHRISPSELMDALTAVAEGRTPTLPAAPESAEPKSSLPVLKARKRRHRR